MRSLDKDFHLFIPFIPFIPVHSSFAFSARELKKIDQQG